MAGPVSTNEIEDFVSSVRRLVSVDARNRPMSRDPGRDRLVLTPDQRVTPEAAKPGDPLILTARVKDEDPDVLSTGAEADAEVANEAQVVEAEWEEELWSEIEAPLAELALGAEEAELVVEVAAVVPDPVPLASDGSEGSSSWGEVGNDWVDEDLELLAPGQAPPVAEQPVDRAAAEPPAKRPDLLKLSAEDMLTDGEGNPLTVLDEAALQLVIRQLIRDELKGVLGERITQSVRKLVRAEINRALAAHALD